MCHPIILVPHPNARPSHWLEVGQEHPAAIVPVDAFFGAFALALHRLPLLSTGLLRFWGSSRRGSSGWWLCGAFGARWCSFRLGPNLWGGGCSSGGSGLIFTFRLGGLLAFLFGLVRLLSLCHLSL